MCAAMLQALASISLEHNCVAVDKAWCEAHCTQTTTPATPERTGCLAECGSASSGEVR